MPGFRRVNVTGEKFGYSRENLTYSKKPTLSRQNGRKFIVDERVDGLPLSRTRYKLTNESFALILFFVNIILDYRALIESVPLHSGLPQTLC
ncbi:hypothetical protein AVEN_136247-1 [Araneus ventricosus]|uniref:Uncharacterized protein n=1 Tax=Araneus ventricosus TaxID=182803 RepID=A0A4Y2BF02_ARAVE|nr:hypothetical protein AVEN_136247-1 [Araneus ventricosus]